MPLLSFYMNTYIGLNSVNVIFVTTRFVLSTVGSGTLSDSDSSPSFSSDIISTSTQGASVTGEHATSALRKARWSAPLISGTVIPSASL